MTAGVVSLLLWYVALAVACGLLLARAIRDGDRP